MDFHFLLLFYYMYIYMIYTYMINTIYGPQSTPGATRISAEAPQNTPQGAQEATPREKRSSILLKTKPSLRAKHTFLAGKLSKNMLTNYIKYKKVIIILVFVGKTCLPLTCVYIQKKTPARQTHIFGRKTLRKYLH